MASSYKICYMCRVIVCSSRSCESPKPDCQKACNEDVDEDNVYYDFCMKCEKRMKDQFDRQLGQKQLPPFNPPHEVDDNGKA
jgi:hypothetical protein